MRAPADKFNEVALGLQPAMAHLKDRAIRLRQHPRAANAGRLFASATVKSQRSG